MSATTPAAAPAAPVTPAVMTAVPDLETLRAGTVKTETKLPSGEKVVTKTSILKPRVRKPKSGGGQFTPKPKTETPAPVPAVSATTPAEPQPQTHMEPEKEPGQYDESALNRVVGKIRASIFFAVVAIVLFLAGFSVLTTRQIVNVSEHIDGVATILDKKLELAKTDMKNLVNLAVYADGEKTRKLVTDEVCELTDGVKALSGAVVSYQLATDEKFKENDAKLESLKEGQVLAMESIKEDMVAEFDSLRAVGQEKSSAMPATEVVAPTAAVVVAPKTEQFIVKMSDSRNCWQYWLSSNQYSKRLYKWQVEKRLVGIDVANVPDWEQTVYVEIDNKWWWPDSNVRLSLLLDDQGNVVLPANSRSVRFYIKDGSGSLRVLVTKPSKITH